MKHVLQKLSIIQYIDTAMAISDRHSRTHRDVGQRGTVHGLMTPFFWLMIRGIPIQVNIWVAILTDSRSTMQRPSLGRYGVTGRTQLSDGGELDTAQATAVDSDVTEASSTSALQRFEIFQHAAAEGRFEIAQTLRPLPHQRLQSIFGAVRH